MKTPTHFLIGLAASIILVQHFNFSIPAGLTIFISSWIIDVDHYFWYLYSLKKKEPNRSNEMV